LGWLVLGRYDMPVHPSVLASWRLSQELSFAIRDKPQGTESPQLLLSREKRYTRYNVTVCESPKSDPDEGHFSSPPSGHFE